MEDSFGESPAESEDILPSTRAFGDEEGMEEEEEDDSGFCVTGTMIADSMELDEDGEGEGGEEGEEEEDERRRRRRDTDAPGHQAPLIQDYFGGDGGGGRPPERLPPAAAAARLRDGDRRRIGDRTPSPQISLYRPR